MTLSCNYRYEDYREAIRAIAQRRWVGGKETLWAGIVTGIATLFLFGLIVGREIVLEGNTQTDRIDRFALNLLPFVLFIGVFWVRFVPMVIPANRPRFRMVFVTFFITGIFFALLRALKPASLAPISDSPVRDMLWNISPWFVLFVGLIVGLLYFLRSMLRGIWEKMPNLHFPHTVRLARDSIEFETEISRSIYRWKAFENFRETPNLFVLQLHGRIFHMIPKRDCKGPGEVEAVRQVLEQNVPMAEPKTLGFAVIPASSQQTSPRPRMVESLPSRTMR